MKPRITCFKQGNPVLEHFNDDEILVSQIILQLPDLIFSECESSKKISSPATTPWGAKKRRSVPLPPPPFKASNVTTNPTTTTLSSHSDLTNMNGSTRVLVLPTPPNPYAYLSGNGRKQKGSDGEPYEQRTVEIKNAAVRMDGSFPAPLQRRSSFFFSDNPPLAFAKSTRPANEETALKEGVPEERYEGRTMSLGCGHLESHGMIDLNVVPSGVECLEPCDPSVCVILVDNVQRAKFKEARKKRAEIQRMKNNHNLNHRVNNPTATTITTVNFKFAAPLPLLPH